eukprot:5251429-Prymnesium_polylepis.1
MQRMMRKRKYAKRKARAQLEEKRKDREARGLPPDPKLEAALRPPAARQQSSGALRQPAAKPDAR